MIVFLNTKNFKKRSSVNFRVISLERLLMILRKRSIIFQVAEKSVLCKHLKIDFSPKDLDYADYMVLFELIFTDIKSVDLDIFQNDSIK